MAPAAALLLLLLLLAGCATTEPSDFPVDEDRRTAPDRAGDVTVDRMTVNTLADVLVRSPGVMVLERAGGVDVRVRGRRPAYAVDGMIVAYSYPEIAMLVPVDDIHRVDVLNGIEATARYGSRGGRGVIEITTRRGAM